MVIFFSNGVESERKIQEIEDCCATVHEATGEKVKREKVVIRSWKWKTSNVVKVTMSAIISGDKIKIKR